MDSVNIFILRIWYWKKKKPDEILKNHSRNKLNKKNVSPLHRHPVWGKWSTKLWAVKTKKKLLMPFGRAIFLQFYVTQKNPHICWAKSSPTTVKPLELESIHKKTQRTQTSGMFACSRNKQEIHLVNKQAQGDHLLGKFHSFVTLTNLCTLGICPRAIL